MVSFFVRLGSPFHRRQPLVAILNHDVVLVIVVVVVKDSVRRPSNSLFSFWRFFGGEKLKKDIRYCTQKVLVGHGKEISRWNDIIGVG